MSDRKYECFKDKHGLGFGCSNLDEEGGFTVLARVPENLLTAYVRQRAIQYLEAQRDRYRNLAEKAETKAKIIQGVITLSDEESFAAFVEDLKAEA